MKESPSLKRSSSLLSLLSIGPKILVNDTHVLQLLEDEPLTLLGQATNFFAGQFLQKIFDCLGDPDCDDFGLLFHVPIINDCRQMSMYLYKIYVAKCIHMLYNEVWNQGTL